MSAQMQLIMIAAMILLTMGLAVIIDLIRQYPKLALNDIVFFTEENKVCSARIDLVRQNKFGTMYRAVPASGGKLIFYSEDIGRKIFRSKRQAKKKIK